MQLANGSSVTGGAARDCRRTGDEVNVVNVVVLDFKVGEMDDDNDKEAEAIHAVNPREIK